MVNISNQVTPNRELAPQAKVGINNQSLITGFSVIINLTNGRGLLDASRRSEVKKRNTRAISPAR